MNKRTHELMLFTHTKAGDLQITSTSLRFDPFDWMSFKLIRSLKDAGAFGLCSKSAFVLVPSASIVDTSGGDLLVDENVECISVWEKDSEGVWQPNSCFS